MVSSGVILFPATPTMLQINYISRVEICALSAIWTGSCHTDEKISYNVTPALRISVSFLANCAIGYMFGPVMGFVFGGLGDTLLPQAKVKY